MGAGGFLQVMTISQRTRQGSYVSRRTDFDAQVTVWSRRRVIAALQAPRTTGLVEAEEEGKRLTEGLKIRVLGEETEVVV